MRVNFKNLFRRNKRGVSFEALIADHLSNAPRCGEYVLVASPEYGQGEYSCEVVASARKLIPWLRRLSEGRERGVTSGDASRQALLMWLEDADLSIIKPVYMPASMFDVFKFEVKSLVDEEIAQVYCVECDKAIDFVHMSEQDRVSMRTIIFWTELWECSERHQLYRKDQEMRFFLSGK